MKKSTKIITLVFVPIIILLVFIFCFNKYLDYRLDKDYSNVIATYYGEPVKDKGISFIKKGMELDDLFIFGSSELGAAVPQNPKNVFPTNELPSNGNVIGKAHCQNLIHSMNIAALGDDVKKHKLVYVVSLQWFTTEGNNFEISEDGFASNFSSIKYYMYMNNKNISRENKINVSKRVESLLKGYDIKSQDYIYARLHTTDNTIKKVISLVMEPYYYLRYKALVIKDKYESIKVVQAVKDKKLETKEFNFKEEYIKAEQQGKSSITNNDFYVNDDYYNDYLKEKLKELKDSSKNVDLDKSNEIRDYKTFLNTCKEIGANPYIVIMPTNGYYYDYIGIDKKMRDKLYDYVEKTASEYGYTALNLKEKEYDPYFMVDAMHLGWKGWLYVDEKITEHFVKDKK